MNAQIAATTIPDSFDDLEIGDVSELLTAFFDDPALFPDPFALFRRLRELEPVHWSKHNTWVITGYPEGREVLYNAVLSREASAHRQFDPLVDRDIDSPEAIESVDILLASLINRDPPDHTRLRKLVSRTFTPKAISSWKPRIDQLVGELVEAVADKPEFDFLHDLAYPLPEAVICELLGVPVEDLRKVFPPRGASAVGSSRVMTVRGDSPTAADDLRSMTQHQLIAQVEYFRTIIEQRKLHPGDDLISALVAAEDEGDRLSMEELIGTVIILIGAGHETTANLVTNGMLALIQNQSAYRALRENPDQLPAALEEILRYASPSPGQPRTALEQIELAGRTINAGDQIFVILNACNRDPRVFENPEMFDISRSNNREHITFTAGIHHCLGASLAKLEATALFRAVFEQLGPLELTGEKLEWQSTYVRSLGTLRVTQKL